MKTKLLSLLITLALIPGFLPVPVQAQSIDDAIDAGVAWLAGQQKTNGSWSGQPPNDYPVGLTGLAVLKLEDYAFERGYDGPFDPDYPYSSNVTKGLEYIFKHTVIKTIDGQQHLDINDDPYSDLDDPDAHVSGDPQNPADRGVYFRTGDSDKARNYETGICMMAIAASRCPGNSVNATGSAVNGWTYKQVLCEAVDYVAYAQTDGGPGRGGWGYWDTQGSDYADNSVSGYVVSGLLYSENPLYGFCCSVPQFVKDELGGKVVGGLITHNWIDTVQHPDVASDDGRGGSAYAYPNDNWGVPVSTLKTGNLLSEMAFVGENKANSTRFQRALEYIERHWHDTNYTSGLQGWGWGFNPPQGPAFYQAAYCLMKGFQAMGISTINVRGSGGNIIINNVDWYQELADVIVLQQDPGGFWADSPYEAKQIDAPPAGPLLSTIWALLALERAVPSSASCDCLGWNPVTISWTDAGGNSQNVPTGCDDTVTIASLNSQYPDVTVSTTPKCSTGCAASENWTVTSSSQGLVAQDDGTTANFPASSGSNYTVTFNATCGRGTPCPSQCSGVSDNVSCKPCTVMVTVSDNTTPTAPCECLGWNPVTVTWTDCNDIQGMKTGQCDTNLIIPQMECGTTVKVSSSVNCSCLGVVTQVPASYEFQPNTIGLYPVTMTANCGDITCPPCNIGILVRNCVKVEASINVVKEPSVYPLCPQLFTLTGKPDDMSEYKWTNLSSNKVEGYGQSLVVDATNWTPGDYNYTLTVTDANGCTDNETVAVDVVGFPECKGCNCEWKLVIDIGWGNTPQKCIPQPCACIDTLKPLYYFPKFCWPKENQPPPCPPPVINSFTVAPAPSFGGPCLPGAPWSLNWDADIPNTQTAWPAPGDSAHPVYIEFKCKDSNNNVQTYWGPEAFEQDGSYTYTLPADFQPCGKECEFCLWSYDCDLNKVMKCQPMSWCDNVTVFLPCPAGCVCASPYWQDIVGKPLCAPCPCESVGPNMLKYCYGTSIGPEPPPIPPTPCPENCDCLTEREALALGYTVLGSMEPCEKIPGQEAKYCYSRCPEGCSCVTEKEADERGYIISCSDEICDSSGKEPKYCFSPPLQPCSQRCQCLTQAQAKEYGYSDAQRCQTTPCKQDAQGRDMYCYPKPKAPVVDVTADRSFVTQGDPVKVCWKVAGEGITEVLFTAAGGKPTPVDPQGCKTFKPTQQTRYLVTAKNAAGSGQDAVTVGVGQPPPVEEEQPPVKEEQPPVKEVCPTIVSFTANCPEAQIFTPWAAKLLLQPRPAAAASLPQTCTLSWMVTGPTGTTVNISGIGTVGMSGSTQVPRGAAPVTVTYTLTASYGSCVRTATVQVPR